MKKYSLLLITLFIWGCEKKYDTPIDPSQSSYTVKEVSSFPGFTYIPGDSLFTAFITVNSSRDISVIAMDVFGTDEKLTSSQIKLYDDGNLTLHGDQTAGDNSYANKFPLKQSYPNGKYKIEYYIVDKYGVSSKAAVHNFTYNNGQNNLAPAISGLTAPDTVVVDSPKTLILLSVAAADSNGLNDIESVFFITYRPDGSSNNSRISLLDNGSMNNGDLIAGDGIFSTIIEVTPANTKGQYRFEFQAQDRGKKLSNKIIHNILLK